MPDEPTRASTLGDAFEQQKPVRCQCGVRLVTEGQAMAHFKDAHGWRIVEGTASA